MKIAHYQQGMPCWVELASKDVTSGKHFYSALFDWQLKEMPTPDGSYIMFAIEDDDIAAAYQLPQTMIDAHVPSHWGIYFAVNDLDTTLELVKKHGGKVVVGPHNVGEAGRMAQCQDPEGSSFSLWQAGQHIGAMRKDEPNTFCWAELACRKPDEAKAFYSKVLGWVPRISLMEDFDYCEWLVGDTAIGGMMEMTEEWGDMPSHWMPYVMVSHCDAIAAKAAEIGGKVCVPPTDIPKVGRFAVLNDPQEGFFSVITLLDE
ncbi:VOC family protein [Shewanella sp. Isolate11]|uniref:VOC family protein n=1 Tax=Shewanella sp. Isolate11 TaxID=2908530 RepID=UPI001EFD7454|nr:VOC family protein [Shewanella sp. Isolate11]MCG9697848.1 VOC family protein [Shewanella sp. Isolate11]